MTSRAEWAKRVEDWRRSGLSSKAFCAGKEFTPGGLRSAACLVQREAGDVGKPKALTAVAVARVVRASLPARRASASGPAPSSLRDVELLVEVGGARVAVGRGCDGATLTTVLEALARVGGAR